MTSPTTILFKLDIQTERSRMTYEGAESAAEVASCLRKTIQEFELQQNHLLAKEVGVLAAGGDGFGEMFQKMDPVFRGVQAKCDELLEGIPNDAGELLGILAHTPISRSATFQSLFKDGEQPLQTGEALIEFSLTLADEEQ